MRGGPRACEFGTSNFDRFHSRFLCTTLCFIFDQLYSHQRIISIFSLALFEYMDFSDKRFFSLPHWSEIQIRKRAADKLNRTSLTGIDFSKFSLKKIFSDPTKSDLDGTMKSYNFPTFRTFPWFIPDLLTFRQNSPELNFFRPIVRPQLRFVANRVAYELPVGWRHLAAYLRSELATPWWRQIQFTAPLTGPDEQRVKSLPDPIIYPRKTLNTI